MELARRLRLGKLSGKLDGTTWRLCLASGCCIDIVEVMN